MCPDHCDALDRRCDVDEKQLREEKPRSLLQVCYHGPFPRRGSWRPSQSFSSRSTHTRSCQREASRCSHPSLWSVTGWGGGSGATPKPRCRIQFASLLSLVLTSRGTWMLGSRSSISASHCHPWAWQSQGHGGRVLGVSIHGPCASPSCVAGGE